MNTERISGGHSAAAQIMVLVTNLSFLLLIIELEIKSKDVGFEESCFVALVVLFIFFIIKNAKDFYDITIVDGEYLAVKNLFNRKKLYLTQPIYIEKGLLPFVFYLKQGTNRYYFFLGTNLLLPSIFTLEPEKALLLLKSKLEKLKHKTM